MAGNPKLSDTDIEIFLPKLLLSGGRKRRGREELQWEQQHMGASGAGGWVSQDGDPRLDQPHNVPDAQL